MKKDMKKSHLSHNRVFVKRDHIYNFIKKNIRFSQISKGIFISIVFISIFKYLLHLVIQNTLDSCKIIPAHFPLKHQ